MSGGKEPDPGEDLRLRSVTSTLAALDKPGLKFWSAEQTAIAAIHSANTWMGMIGDCGEDCEHLSAAECPAVKWLRNAHMRPPQDGCSAAELGRQVHAACESYALHGVRPSVDAEVRLYLEQFQAFCDLYQPTFEAVEAVVYSPTHGYAGTLDAIVNIDGWRAIVDYKTTRQPFNSHGWWKPPYPQVSLQLAAYRHAEYVATWRAEKTQQGNQRYYLITHNEREHAAEMPKVDGGFCLQISPQKAKGFEVGCGWKPYCDFLIIQQAARWAYEDSRHAVKAQPFVDTLQIASGTD